MCSSDLDQESRYRRLVELENRSKDELPRFSNYLVMHDRITSMLEAFAWAARASADEEEGKPPATLPPQLAPFTTVKRAHGALEVTVQCAEDEKVDLAVLSFAAPPTHRSSAPAPTPSSSPAVPATRLASPTAAASTSPPAPASSPR